MRILADIRFEQLQGGEQKTLDFLEGLLPDEGNEAALRLISRKVSS